MANWLQALVGGLAGAGRAGVDYAMQKRELERIEEEQRRAAMERDRAFALQRDQFDYGRTRDNIAALAPDANIAGTALETDARRFGVPLRERTRVNSMVEVPAAPITAGTAISMPEVGGLPAMPPLPGVSPTPGPLPQGEQTPFTLPSVGKAFAMPETPTTRTVGRMPTAQEQMRQRMAETQLPEYRELLDTAPPELKPIIAMTIKQLEQGLDPELTVGQAAGLVRPAKPEEDKDLLDPEMRSDFSAALNIPFEQVPERWSAMTPAQRNTFEAWKKEHRGVNPQPQIIMGGGGLTMQQNNFAKELRTSLRGERAYQAMAAAQEAVAAANNALEMGTGAADIMAINLIQRGMVDPGVAVREGDVALLQKASPFFAKFFSEFPFSRLQTGSILPPEAREELRRVANNVVREKTAGFNSGVEKVYRQQAEAAGIPFEMVFEGTAQVIELMDAQDKLRGRTEGETWTSPAGTVYAKVGDRIVKVR